jgi:hypothetical protein
MKKGCEKKDGRNKGKDGQKMKERMDKTKSRKTGRQSSRRQYVRRAQGYRNKSDSQEFAFCSRVR